MPVPCTLRSRPRRSRERRCFRAASPRSRSPATASRRICRTWVALPPGNSATHPCLLAFGEQSGGTTFFGGFGLPWGIRYHELMVAVPFVGWQGAAGEHLFVSGMACDFWPAVWNGNFYYGFKKRFARMGWSGDHFAVEEDGRRAGFDAVVRSQGEVPGAFAGWNTRRGRAPGAWPPA